MSGEKYGRRGFLELAGSVVLLGGMDGEVAPQLEAQDLDTDGDFEVYGLVLGQRPSQSEIEASWDTYRLVHIDTETGVKAYITHLTSGWQEIPLPLPETQIDEVRVEDFSSFFNHTFARPNAPDDKNWVYTDADITKDGSELELAGTTTLESNQRGNYPPGGEAVPGVAFRVTAAVTGGECFAGYFLDSDDDNVPEDGFGFGMDTTGTFTFIAKDGTLRRVYQEDWNGPDSVDTDPFRLHFPRICRFPHLFYGGGSIAYRIVDHQDSPTTKLKTVHIETPETAADAGAPFDAGPPFSQPNLPVAFVTNALSGGSLRANAAHYEIGQDQGETRVNGEHFSGISVGTGDWTPLLSWRKRSGWDMVNVKPLQIAVLASSADVKLELQLDPTLSDPEFALPTHSSGDETAVEVDIANEGDATDTTLSTDGERRWTGFAGAGQGSQPGSVVGANLDFNLPADQIVTLAAQGTGSATVSGAVNWEEFF